MLCVRKTNQQDPMVRRIPPLNHLRAFEAAARHLSFRGAAEELNVTHAAVSHQIRALEERFGIRLFNRITRGVTLTDEARDLADVLTKALDDINAGVGKFEAGAMVGTIKISAVPWYVNKVLQPNIERLNTELPDLTLEFDFSYTLTDFRTGEVNAALRHGLGKWPGLTAIRIHHDHLGPLCGPSLAQGRKLPLTPAEISELPLAAARGYEHVWQDWFDLVGYRPKKEPEIILFENRAVATEFAMAGNGVSLSDVQVNRNDILDGRMLRLHPGAVRQETGAHLVFPEGPLPDPRLERIAEWMRQSFAAIPID